MAAGSLERAAACDGKYRVVDPIVLVLLDFSHFSFTLFTAEKPEILLAVHLCTFAL